jgi:hypothetical protein
MDCSILTLAPPVTRLLAIISHQTSCKVVQYVTPSGRSGCASLLPNPSLALKRSPSGANFATFFLVIHLCIRHTRFKERFHLSCPHERQRQPDAPHSVGARARPRDAEHVWSKTRDDHNSYNDRRKCQQRQTARRGQSSQGCRQQYDTMANDLHRHRAGHEHLPVLPRLDHHRHCDPSDHQRTSQPRRCWLVRLNVFAYNRDHAIILGQALQIL